MLARRRPAACVVTGLTALALMALGVTGAPPSAAADAFSIQAPSTLRVGDRLVVTGTPGRAFAGQVAVLETVGTTRTSFQLQSGVVRPDGRVRLASAVALPGTWDIRVRVLKGRSTIARSDVDTVRVRGVVRQPAAVETASGLRMLAHAQTRAESSGLRGRALPAAPAGLNPVIAQSLQSLTVAENAISGGIGVPQAPQQQFGGSAGSIASLLGAGIVDWGIGFALNAVVAAIFPGSGNQTQQALTRISGQLQQVQSQLSQIEASLSNLETQVTQDFAQVEVLGSDALCLSLLQEANGYVDSLQVLQDQAQIALSPQWLAANVAPYANTPAAVRAVGNQMFGSGPGTPSFASGLIGGQQAVTDLANLLIDDGAGGTPGLISTCATAIAAQVIAENPVSVNGKAPIGAIDAAFFTPMQQLVAYYATWVTVGQVLTAQGGQMAISQLQPEPPTTAAAVQEVCAGAIASGPPSLLTCPGLLAQINQTQATIAQAWNLTGATWSQVTDGLLAADTQVDQAAGVLVPRNAWTIDLATYGAPVVGPDLPTISSVSAATGPAAAVFGPTGAPALGTTTWAGLPFQPANAASWDFLLGVTGLPPYANASAPASTACITASSGTATSCAAGSTIAQMMATLGLLANGTTPSNLIVYTGDTSTWNMANASAIGQIYGSGNNSVVQQSAPTLAVNAFLDSSFVPVQGASTVVGGPGGALTPASLYPYAATVQATAEFTQYPGAWQLTPSPASPPALSGYTQGFPAPLTYCYPSPPLSTAGMPLTMGQIMGLSNGKQGIVNLGQPGCATFFIPTMNPIPLTANPSFYAPLNLQFGYDSSGDSVQGARTNLTGALPGWVSGSSGPGSGGTVAQQSQYLWPVVPLANPGCATTAFTQGVTGRLGVPNTCASAWQEWSAVNTGQTTGSIALSAPVTQGTQQQGGANVAGVVLTNSSTSSQLATLTVAAASGSVQPQGMLTPVGASGPLPTGCQSSVQGLATAAPTAPSEAVSCTFVVPPGVSAVNIPVTYGSAGSGTLAAALTGGGNVSATTIAVTNTPAVPAQPPAAVTNLAVSASTGTAVTLTWEPPASQLPVTGYSVTLESPAGTTSSQSISTSSVTVAGTNASATVALPGAQAGYWQFQLAAVSAAGAGASASTTAYLGSGPPPAPANLTAVENPDGTVTLSWTPITALPAVSGYAIVVTDPTGVPRPPVTVSVPAFTTGPLRTTGTYSFAVSATNTAGTGPSATATATLLGVVPGAPQSFIISVTDNGWVSATWAAPSTAVPAPTSYVLRAYDSGGRAVRSMEIPSRGLVSTMSVPRFFTLGSNSPTGPWTFVVAARNSGGLGQTARSVVEVTPGLVSGIGSTQSVDAQLGQVPMLLADLDASECRAGFPVESTFGTCMRRSWTPTAR